MKKFFYILITASFLLSAKTNAQVIFDFGAGTTATAAPIGYNKAGVGTYYRSTTGGTVSDGTANCDGYTPSKTTSSSLFIFVAVNDITSITVRGTGTGSNRTFSSLTTSATLSGTYTSASATGVGTILNSSTCGSIVITPAATIPAGTYMTLTFSGNLNVTSLLLAANIGTPPTVTTNNPVATLITSASATLGGQVTDTGTTAVTVSGVCYGLNANPTITADSKTTDGPTAVGAISSAVSGLAFSTTYHVRAYAKSNAGTSYGADQTFVTLPPSSPTVIINPLSLSFGSVLLATTSAEKTVTIIGGGLTPASGNLIITAPAAYEVSATSGSGFATSISLPYTGGLLASTTIYVRFKPTALIAYNGNITVTGGGIATQNIAVTGAGTDIAYNVGDYISVTNGNWGTASTWNKWNGSAWVASVDFPNAITPNVYIDGEDTVTVDASARSLNNLYIQNGAVLKSNSQVRSPVYLKVYGSTVQINSGCRMGSTSAALGDGADGLSIDYFGTGINPTLTITGAGAMHISRLRTNTSRTTVIVDKDFSLNYHGSSNTGNAAGFYTVAGDSNTLTINTGKTLTFAPWSCYTPVSSSHTNGTFNQTININGTLTFVPGNPAPDTITPSRIGWHASNYMSAGVTGKAFIINIASTGTLNATEFYPNGTKADNTAGTGDLITINVVAGGVLNVNKIADFRKATQFVTGAGAFNLLTGSKIRIGAPEGITTTDATGPVQTTTRSFSTGAAYAYEGTAAQVSGNAMPSTVSGLIINNATGLTLSNSVQTSDSLNLTNGIITSGTANMLTIGAAAATNGGSTASHVAGPVTKLTTGTTAYAFPIGKGGVYRSASVSPADASASSYTAEYFAISGTNTTSLISPLTSVGTSEYWDISRNSGAGAVVSLNYDNTRTTTWSNGGVPSPTQLITVAHLLNGSWVDEAGTTLAGDATSGNINSQTLNSFSPFTFGLKAGFPVPLKLLSFNATKVTGQTKLFWTTSNEINLNRYEIEKSTDNRKFVLIGNVTANNLSNNNYSFTDAEILAGVSYYRLKIVDKDGRFTYSSTIAVNNRLLNAVNIFPNPVKDNLFISHEKAAKGAKLEVYGFDGRKINEINVVDNAVQTTLNTAELPKGTYSLVFVNGMNIQHIPFIKQ